jgi:ATP-dependent Clp protease ATP-binding subunit ClpC
MFERFTERARRAVVLAQEEARELHHSHIGTEHLLLGLLREQDGIASRVLGELGLAVEDVRADVLRIVGRGDDASSGQIPFTPDAKRVLELALREALTIGHNYIGTEHLLLGIARDDRGVACDLLRSRGVDGERVREAIFSALGGRTVALAPRPPSTPTSSRHYRKRSALSAGRLLIGAWLLGAVSLGAGIAIGWVIWG